MLICLTGFLLLPNISLAVDINDIDLREMGKYLELPARDAQGLLFTLNQVFTTDWIYRESSGFSTAEECLVPLILRKAVRIQVLNHLLIDVPIQTTWIIVKNSLKMARIFLASDPSVILNELEKESVKKAVGYGMSVLLEKEIKVTPGAIEYEYISQGGIKQKIIIQYILIYQPYNSKKGEALIRFYSPQSIDPPRSEGSIGIMIGTPHSVKEKLPPFIVDIRGTLENYKWVGRPSINIDFPSEVPDLGIKPLSLWERFILKPIESTIKDIEVVITKITGKSLGLPGIWDKIKTFVSGITNLFSPAAIITSSGEQEEKKDPAPSEKPGEVRPLQTEKPGEVRPLQTEKPGEVRPLQDENKEEVEPLQEEAEVCRVNINTASKEELQKIISIGPVLAQRIIDARPFSSIYYLINVSGIGEITLQKIIEQNCAFVDDSYVEEEEIFEEIEEETTAATTTDICPVNINTASKEELQAITGIGPVLAQRIIDARPFSSIYNLTRVSGIGEITLQKIITQDCAYVVGDTGQPTFYYGGGGGGVSTPSPTPSPITYSKILISELQINPIEQRFIELYNPNDQTVNLTGWYIQRKTATGATWGSLVTKTNFENEIIQPHSYFLIARSSALIPDILVENLTLTEDNSIVLKNPKGEIVDLLGYGEAQNFEIAPFPENPRTRDLLEEYWDEKGIDYSNVKREGSFTAFHQSLGRKVINEGGGYQDIDNNAEDFEIQTPTPGMKNKAFIEQKLEDVLENIKDYYDTPIGIEIISGPASSTEEIYAVFEFQAAKEHCYFECRLNEEEWQDCESPKIYEDLEEGEHTFSVRATDLFLNIDFAEYFWIIETLLEKKDETFMSSFTFFPQDPLVDEEIIFDASSSTSSASQIISYFWDFGEGTTTTLIQSTTSHAYLISGDFTVNLTVVDDNNATSSATTTVIVSAEPTPEEPTLEVVINEIAWMGTEAGHAHEWIELYNNTAAPIDLTGWTLNAADGTPSITFLTSTIQNYFLLERTDDSRVSDIPADLIYTGNLGDDGEKLELRNASGSLIDVVDCSNGWFSGNKENRISMERIDSTSSGSDPNNWASNNLITRNGLDAEGNKINGTPRAENSVSKSETEISGTVDYPVLTYLGNPYIVTSNLVVPSGHTLIIEPGVTLKFSIPQIYGPNDGAHLKVYGNLIAVGQPQKEIVFTSTRELWPGIVFESSEPETEISSQLEYVRVEKARSWERAMYSAVKVNQKAISIKNSALEYNSNYRGLYLINSYSIIDNVNFSGFTGSSNQYNGEYPSAVFISGGAPKILNSNFSDNYYGISVETNENCLVRQDFEISQNTFVQNYIPILLKSQGFPCFSQNQVLGAGKDMYNNVFDGIYIGGSFDLYQNTVWQADLPIILGDRTRVIAGSLTVKAGMEIKFKYGPWADSRGRLIITGGGELITEGNENDYVIFTSAKENPAAGNWMSIRFEEGSFGDLNYTRIEYGGFGSGIFRNQCLIIESDNVSQSEVEKEFCSPY